MSQQPLDRAHPDFSTLAPLVTAIVGTVGGQDEFELEVPQLLRVAIDEVIDAPRTGRFLLEDTEKTEKTYLGTKIEILLRGLLGFPKGKTLDLNINGVEIDIKNTMRSNWSIPVENLGKPAILIRSSEAKAVCDFGVAVLKDEYLRPGKNRDSKRGVSADGMSNVWWILKNHPYPENFWQLITHGERQEIMSAGGGTARLASLFEKLQRTPISRIQIQAIGQQHDYMKRIRRNGGARDILAPKGIAILWGSKDKALIDKLGLGPLSKDEFISYAPRNNYEQDLLRKAGHID